MKSLWVLGFGKFGELAVQRLQERHTSPEMTVIDLNPERCNAAEALGAKAFCEDAVQFLHRNLSRTPPPDWIVPAVPIHVAWRWIKEKIDQREGREIVQTPIPEECTAQLPNPMTGPTGQVYMSLADFICPDDCSEPAGVCTVTGKQRPYSLFEKLADLDVAGYESVVVRSRQLAPGVGGYTPSDLYDALDRIRNISGSGFLSTACRCHGVMHGFAVK
jgi:hypothetical protein